MRNSICFIFATDSSNHIPSRLESCSTVQPGHILLPAGTFIFATKGESVLRVFPSSEEVIIKYLGHGPVEVPGSSTSVLFKVCFNM